MQSFYHSGDLDFNTLEIKDGGEIAAMEETLGKRLKRMRQAAKLTQTALARKTGLAQGQIGNIETDARGYGLSVVVIAQALGTSPEYLTMETDDPAPKFRALDLAQDLPPADKPLSSAAIALAQWFDTIPEENRMRAHAAIVQTIIGAKIVAKVEARPIADTSPVQIAETQHG